MLNTMCIDVPRWAHEWSRHNWISFCHENVISGNQPQFKKIKLEEQKHKIDNVCTFYKLMWYFDRILSQQLILKPDVPKGKSLTTPLYITCIVKIWKRRLWMTNTYIKSLMRRWLVAKRLCHYVFLCVKLDINWARYYVTVYFVHHLHVFLGGKNNQHTIIYQRERNPWFNSNSNSFIG